MSIKMYSLIPEKQAHTPAKLAPTKQDYFPFFNFPDGQGRFVKGIDGRGNSYEKRKYDSGLFIKQERLHNGQIKLTAISNRYPVEGQGGRFFRPSLSLFP